MASEFRGSSVIGERYANALIALAETEKNSDKVTQDLKDLETMLTSSPELLAAIRSPRTQASALQAIVDALSDQAKFQTLTKKFLGVLVENGRLPHITDVLNAYHATVAKRRGELVAHVDVAQDLSEAQKKDLQSALSKALGKDVSVRLRVAPEILGGMVVTVGSKMMDDSVRRKLEKMKLSLGVTQTASVNENSMSRKNEVA